VHTGRSHDADTSGGWSVSCDNSGTNHSGCRNDHYHNWTSNNPTDGSLVDTITYASVNQEPPHRKIIFIKPSQGLSPLRDDIIGLYSGASIPTGWTLCVPTDTGFESAGAYEIDATHDWTNGNNTYAADESFATAQYMDNVEHLGGFGFTIPAGAVITGIEIKVKGKSASAGGEITAGFYSTSGDIEANGHIIFTTTNTEYTIGGQRDLLGTVSANWTPADFADGTVIFVLNTVSDSNLISVDHVQAKIYYTENGAPDLGNRYLKGAAGGADSDVTTDNGALTHTHDVGHTHTAVEHSHYILTDSATADERSTQSGSGVNERGHQHGANIAGVSQAGGAYTGTVTSGTVEPVYKKLLAIKNTTGSVSMPKGIVGMWLGSLITIPIGWVLCDGNNGTEDMRDYHLKIANALAEVGNTGGANTHVHAASNSHNHAGASHGHAIPTMSQEAGTRDPQGSGMWCIQHHHVHPSNNGRVDAATTVYSSTTISGDSSNNEPAYRTVAFIQYVFSTGGAMLFHML
jgi:hypothetical protein